MHTITHQRPYLRISEVALELGVSAETIRRMVKRGELPVTQFGGPGSTVRISRAALEEWLTSRTRS